MSSIDEHYPLVSIIIPVYNEEKYIGKCLDSVLADAYQKTKLEILVIDGMSIDGTRNIIDNYSIKYPFINLIDNPKRVQAAALNIGIKKAKGSVIIRMDAHSFFMTQDFVRKCVELILAPDIDNVGGVIESIGSDYVSKAIAIATTSAYGIGNAYFRLADKVKNEIWVDTVFPGCWKKTTLEKVGSFNEEFCVNEDYELNYRIRRAGGKILLSPQIRSGYYVRSTIYSLFQQYFRYGYWKARTVLTHPSSLRWRQAMPPLFVSGFAVSIIMILSGLKIGMIIPLLYLSATIVSSLKYSIKTSPIYFPLLLIIFPIIHFSWGTGLIVGVARWGCNLLIPYNKKFFKK